MAKLSSCEGVTDRRAEGGARKGIVRGSSSLGSALAGRHCLLLRICLVQNNLICSPGFGSTFVRRLSNMERVIFVEQSDLLLKMPLLKIYLYVTEHP